MSSIIKFVSVFIAITSIAVGFGVYNLFKTPPTPPAEEKWWGPGEPSKEDNSIRKFEIKISDTALNDLKQRLNSVRPFTPPLEGIQQQYGFNTNLLKNILDYWRTKYNWREREKFLNQYPQYKTKIQGLDIHYLHIKPKTNLRTVPLLIAHGWPGSVREFYELIPLLTTPQEGRDFVFEVIAPSLPGYAFSDAAAKPGLGAFQIATVMHNLMKRIGFEKYYIQGGDWGAMITRYMVLLYPDSILGYHSNLCMSLAPKTVVKLLLNTLNPYSNFRTFGQWFSTFMEETGYYHIQSTKPDTVGVALNESPIGLAAYMLEKFSTGTNPLYKKREDGGLLEKFTYDKLLDNVMIYWFTGSMTTAMRIYAESTSKAQQALKASHIPLSEKVPIACSKFKSEIAYQPDCMLKDVYQNLIQSKEYDFGGHFIALEEPKILAEDIFEAIHKMEIKRK